MSKLVYRVRFGVKGATRYTTAEYDTYQEAEDAAARWERSNSIGSYVARIETLEAPANIERYSVMLEDGWDVATLIEICERLYKVSYGRSQYYVQASTGYLYCGSDYMGQVLQVRASREVGSHQTFEAVAKLVKL